MQDAHAALRYLISNAPKYGIDTTAIFVGGVSAGALTAMGISYMNQTDFDNHYPEITGELGRIDNSTNDLNTKFSVKGVINMWGQIADTSFISHEEVHHIPVIIFHSTADSSQSPYEKALQLVNRFKNLGGCYQLHTSTGKGHTEGISKYYIAEQTGCFLKSVLFNSCNSLETEVNNEDFSCFDALTIDNSIYHRSYFKPDSLIMSQYEGIYKSEGGKIKIVLENEHLFIVDEQNGFKAEMYPESENDFYLRDDNIQFTFIRNENGQVNGLTFFIDAKEISAKRIR